MGKSNAMCLLHRQSLSYKSCQGNYSRRQVKWKKPFVSDFKFYGSNAWTHIPKEKRTKLEPKSQNASLLIMQRRMTHTTSMIHLLAILFLEETFILIRE